MLKVTHNSKGYDADFHSDVLTEGYVALRGLYGNELPHSLCKSVAILCSNKDLGFNTFFQKCTGSSLKGNLTPHEEAKHNPKVNARFFNYDIADIFLSNQTKHNSVAPQNILK